VVFQQNFNPASLVRLQYLVKQVIGSKNKRERNDQPQAEHRDQFPPFSEPVNQQAPTGQQEQGQVNRLDDQGENKQGGQDHADNQHKRRKSFPVEHQNKRAEDKRGTGIFLQKDQSNRNTDDQETQEPGIHILHSNVVSAQETRQGQCSRYFGKLRRLQSEITDGNPCLIPTHRGPDQQHQDEEENGQSVKAEGEGTEELRVQ